jgi:hypothetical protein
MFVTHKSHLSANFNNYMNVSPRMQLNFYLALFHCWHSHFAHHTLAIFPLIVARLPKEKISRAAASSRGENGEWDEPGAL